MSLTPPDASTALTETNANEAAIVAAANTAFIQIITVLIDNAINNNKFAIYPPLADNVDYNVIYSYFTGLGYTVSITFAPIQYFGQPYPPIPFPAGWPEVVPPGWPFWTPPNPPPAYPAQGWTNWQYYVQQHHPLMVLTWGTPP